MKKSTMLSRAMACSLVYAAGGRGVVEWGLIGPLIHNLDVFQGNQRVCRVAAATTGGRRIDRAERRSVQNTIYVMPSNNNCEPHTPPKSIKRVEYDTLRKARFFNAFDTRKSGD